MRRVASYPKTPRSAPYDNPELIYSDPRDYNAKIFHIIHETSRLNRGKGYKTGAEGEAQTLNEIIKAANPLIDIVFLL